MLIKKYLNTTEAEVNNKKFNILIGVSLGNKYFTKENIGKYIEWALEKTREDVLVVVADRIHAINLEVLKDFLKLRAFRKAFRMGDQKIKEIHEIIDSLPENTRSFVRISRWSETTKTKYHDYRVEILFEEFNKKGEFYEHIVDIVKDNFKNHPKKITQKELEKLSEYILHEIPMFLNGAKHEGKIYDLTIYPGIGAIDYLILGLQDGTMFPDLAKKLKITDKIAILEGYVN